MSVVQFKQIPIDRGDVRIIDASRPRHLFDCYTISGLTRWFEQDPGIRSILARDGETRRYYFPHVVFIIQYGWSGAFLRLHVFFADASIRDGGCLYTCPLPHVGAGGEICLGTTIPMIVDGRLHPIEAFWHTTFSLPPSGPLDFTTLDYTISNHRHVFARQLMSFASVPQDQRVTSNETIRLAIFDLLTGRGNVQEVKRYLLTSRLFYYFTVVFVVFIFMFLIAFVTTLVSMTLAMILSIPINIPGLREALTILVMGCGFFMFTSCILDRTLVVARYAAHRLIARVRNRGSRGRDRDPENPRSQSDRGDSSVVVLRPSDDPPVEDRAPASED